MKSIESHEINENSVLVPDAVYDSTGRMILPKNDGRHLHIKGSPEDVNLNSIMTDALRSGVIAGNNDRRLRLGNIATIGVGAFIGYAAIKHQEQYQYIAPVSAFMIGTGINGIFRKKS